MDYDNLLKFAGSFEDAVNRIETDFSLLKEKGLMAKNPDQSSAMMRSFQDDIETCRWKGFAEPDIQLLFDTAREQAGTDLDEIGPGSK